MTHHTYYISILLDSQIAFHFILNWIAWYGCELSIGKERCVGNKTVENLGVFIRYPLLVSYSNRSCCRL